MKETIKNYVLKQFKGNNKVKVNVTKIDYEPSVKYDTIVGVWVNDVLEEVFELENINNIEIDEFMKDINTMINKNTLFII